MNIPLRLPLLEGLPTIGRRGKLRVVARPAGIELCLRDHPGVRDDRPDRVYVLDGAEVALGALVSDRYLELIEDVARRRFGITAQTARLDLGGGWAIVREA